MLNIPHHITIIMAGSCCNGSSPNGLMRFGDVESAVKRHVTTTSCGDSSGNYDILDLEIDHGCCQGPTGQRHIQLYKYQEVPNFLKSNPYVLNGYRSLLPFSLCCKSLFVWSNETVNVWSHLGGCFIFAFLLLYDNVFALPATRASLADHIILSIGLLCFQFCLLASAGYHLFNCHSERAAKRWLSLDLAGISVGLLGCYLPGVHYAFYCLSIWRDIYLIVISILFLGVMLFQTTPKYLSRSWDCTRILVYCGLVAYGIFPTIHWIILNGGSATPIVQLFLPKVATMYALGVLAFFFYMTKFPECYFPGHFDFLGSSHQLWHMVVVIAFIYWHDAGRELLMYRLDTPCLS